MLVAANRDTPSSCGTASISTRWPRSAAAAATTCACRRNEQAGIRGLSTWAAANLSGLGRVAAALRGRPCRRVLMTEVAVYPRGDAKRAIRWRRPSSASRRSSAASSIKSRAPASTLAASRSWNSKPPPAIAGSANARTAATRKSCAFSPSSRASNIGTAGIGGIKDEGGEYVSRRPGPLDGVLRVREGLPHRQRGQASAARIGPHGTGRQSHEPAEAGLSPVEYPRRTNQFRGRWPAAYVEAGDSSSWPNFGATGWAGIQAGDARAGVAAARAINASYNAAAKCRRKRGF
jgi:hypothetical protein